MKMGVLKAYYYVCAEYLKEYIPYIPEIKLSDAKGYYGKISRKNGEFTAIYLSRYNLDCGKPSWWDREDIDELIDTICHEFAHMLFWEHGEDHTRATELFTSTVKAELEIHNLKTKFKMVS